MIKRSMTCILCPMGCTLLTEQEENGEIRVSGNSCPRGAVYARSELTAPVRSLTTTVRHEDGTMIPVRSAAPIPKELLLPAVRQLAALTLRGRVEMGQVLIEDLCGCGVALISCGRHQ